MLVNKIHSELTKLDFKSIIVTPEDVDIPLSERTKRIREYEKQFGKKNCLTISLHLNASDTNSNAKG